MNKRRIVCGAMAAVMLLGTAPMANAATPFADVPGDSWYAGYVDYAYNHKLMTGTSDAAFSPNQTMTRGMLVTVLHSMADKPAPTNRNPFDDVGDMWYTDAVSWCYENGIVAGTSATTFSPNHSITREQMVTILHRYAEVNKADVSKRADLSGYADLSSVESYAADSFSWAVASGIIKGTNATTLSPKKGATRAECAVVLQRYHELLNGNAAEHVHTWDDGTVTKEPTCNEEGIKTYHCTHCGDTKSEKIPIIDHDWEHHDAEGYYETVISYKATYVCIRCGASFNDVEECGVHCIDCNSRYTMKKIKVQEEHWVETKPAYDECTMCHITRDKQ